MKKIKILYEDKDILVIDKPPGISVHPDGRSNDPSTLLRTGKTITDWFLKKYPKSKNVGEPMRARVSQVESNQVSKVKNKLDFKLLPRPGIVHRLDKETSGVLLLAKNQKAYEFLKEQFSAPALRLKTKSGLADKQNRIEKTYVAIVEGWPKADHGIINKPIGRSPSDFRRRLAGRGARGELREAITEYKVLKRFNASGVQNLAKSSQYFYLRGSRPEGEGRRRKNIENSEPCKFSFLEIFPKTGRTHQIRVHMKFLSHPVVCDFLYNPKGFCPKGLDRLALHAKSIEFLTPSGKKIKVESLLPKEFKRTCPALNF